MSVRKATIVRFILLLIGIYAAVSGLASSFSSGQINLIPIPGLTYANSFSGIAVGTLGILIALAEAGELYKQRQQKKETQDTEQLKN